MKYDIAILVASSWAFRVGDGAMLPISISSTSKNKDLLIADGYATDKIE